MPDIPANGSTTAVLNANANGTYFGSLELNNDVDWWKIDVIAGYTYSFRLGIDINSATPLDDGRMQLISPQGSVITSMGPGDKYMTFTATTTGPYFVSVYDTSNDNAAEGDYKIEVLAGDDIVANASTNRNITSSGITNGALGQSYDADWFRVQLVAGRTYDFMLTGDDSAKSLDDGRLQLINASGTDISTVSKNTHISVTPTTSGTFYLIASDSSEYDYQPEGNYRIISKIGDLVQNNSSTTRWVSATPIAEKLEQSNDSDWYKVNFKAGLTYGFRLTGDGSAATLDDGQVNVIDGGNVIRASAETNGTAGYTATTTGLHYIEVKDDSFYDYTAEGNYVLTSYLTDTIVGNAATTSVLAANGRFSSRTDAPGDTDWIKVAMKEGLSYGYTIAKLGGSTGVSDPDLFLFDTNATTLLAGSANYSANSYSIAMTAATNGIYYLQAGSTQDTDMGNYTVTSIATDTVRSDAQSSARLLDGARIAGRMDVTNDSDWYGMQVKEGRVYKITLSGDGGAQQLANKFVGVYDSNGTLKSGQYAYGYGNTTAATLNFTADKGGMIYIGAKGYFGSDLGNFRLQVSSDTFAFNGNKAANDMFANDGKNQMNGYGGKDILRGLGGDDRIFGDGGNDTLFGNIGRDKLFGGNGNDHLYGGKDNDVLKGGAGKDVFHFSRGEDRDVVVDFKDNTDTLHFSGLGVKTIRQALAHADQQGSDVVFNFGKGDVLVVQDMTIAALGNDIVLG